ncbi:MAG: DNA alkylation repair protein [Syntrophomonas sp.]
MWYTELIDIFHKNRDETKAAPMAAYMKHKFSYLGIPKPIRTGLQKDFIKAARKQKALDWEMVNMLWALPEREFQYLVLDYLLALSMSLVLEDIERIKMLITSKSWWDTVDMLASNIVGAMCVKHPELVSSHILKWAESDNIWLVRTATLFQLKYKTKTDTELLARVIGINNLSQEFFINKAIGWALREYSKTDPEWVRQFLAVHQLHPLSVREASKYIP